eukprot:scaffold5055_cov129-Isochrysis_galbana.AAC.2
MASRRGGRAWDHVARAERDVAAHPVRPRLRVFPSEQLRHLVGLDELLELGQELLVGRLSLTEDPDAPHVSGGHQPLTELPEVVRHPRHVDHVDAPCQLGERMLAPGEALALPVGHTDRLESPRQVETCDVGDDDPAEGVRNSVRRPLPQVQVVRHQAAICIPCEEDIPRRDRAASLVVPVRPPSRQIVETFHGIGLRFPLVGAPPHFCAERDACGRTGSRPLDVSVVGSQIREQPGSREEGPPPICRHRFDAERLHKSGMQLVQPCALVHRKRLLQRQVRHACCTLLRGRDGIPTTESAATAELGILMVPAHILLHLV